MRVIGLGLVALVFMACSPSSNQIAIAQSQAADFRTQLDLLLGEHVLIVAKESDAAVNQSDEYSGYTALLTINTDDLTSLMRRAFGSTTAVQFSKVWALQNGYLVEYAIGVVTHNQDRADSAMTHLNGDFAPQIAQLLGSVTQLPVDQITELMKNQLTAIKGMIDDEFALKYAVVYAELHTAYTMATGFGDLLAQRIAQKFPDKFPGDPSLKAVALHVLLNELLQEHAYLATMATDAAINGRDAEKVQAMAALSTNANSLASMVNESNSDFKEVWTSRIAAIEAYAQGDATSKKTLTTTFVSQFSSLTKISASVVTDQANATIKVIDDQRGKSLQSLAGDDRAAATAMQPIADALAPSVQR